jgi:hypothetical protein
MAQRFQHVAWTPIRPMVIVETSVLSTSRWQLHSCYRFDPVDPYLHPPKAVLTLDNTPTCQTPSLSPQQVPIFTTKPNVEFEGEKNAFHFSSLLWSTLSFINSITVLSTQQRPPITSLSTHHHNNPNCSRSIHSCFLFPSHLPLTHSFGSPNLNPNSSPPPLLPPNNSNNNANC